MMRRSGQSSLEICVLVIVIVGALIAMQTYVKRAIQGRMRLAADDIGQQYSPGNTYSGMYTYLETGSVSVSSIINPRNQADGRNRSTTEQVSSVTLRKGDEKVRQSKYEYFGN
ncbi:MAG: hypothetical protein PHR44_08115 [Candidatus Omnitrophica bacterium]|nr:hypothetical protein [Candidatus Omnitrophota bacterium]